MKYASVVIEYPDVYLEKDSKLGRTGTHIGVISGFAREENPDSAIPIITDLGIKMHLISAGILDGKYIEICQREICDCCSGKCKGCRDLIAEGKIKEVGYYYCLK